jgi:hypothetical protein
MPVIPVNKVADRKRITGKRRAEEEERHKGRHVGYFKICKLLPSQKHDQCGPLECLKKNRLKLTNYLNKTFTYIPMHVKTIASTTLNAL